MEWTDEVDARWTAGREQLKTITITAGHSDTDPGAAANGYTEADIVTEFRDLVSMRLTVLGIRHVTDGDDGENWPLSLAVEMAADADIAVEFHCNAATPAASGTETLSRPAQFALGEQLCQATAHVLGIANRGAKPEGSGQHSRLAYVSSGGGIIHELFFMTNLDDLVAYQERKGQLAVAVADVIAAASLAA